MRPARPAARDGWQAAGLTLIGVAGGIAALTATATTVSEAPAGSPVPYIRHVDLRLTDLSVRVGELRDQLGQVKRILKEVE